MKKIWLLIPAFFLLGSLDLQANKTSVQIKAPETLKEGSEAVFVITVTHKGNSASHHTDWVIIKLGGKEIKRWEYTKEKLPPDGIFTLEYKVKPAEDLKVEVQGHCNLHGSAGPASLIMKLTK